MDENGESKGKRQAGARQRDKSKALAQNQRAPGVPTGREAQKPKEQRGKESNCPQPILPRGSVKSHGSTQPKGIRAICRITGAQSALICEPGAQEKPHETEKPNNVLPFYDGGHRTNLSNH